MPLPVSPLGAAPWAFSDAPSRAAQSAYQSALPIQYDDFDSRVAVEHREGVGASLPRHLRIRPIGPPVHPRDRTR